MEICVKECWSCEGIQTTSKMLKDDKNTMIDKQIYRLQAIQRNYYYHIDASKGRNGIHGEKFFTGVIDCISLDCY